MLDWIDSKLRCYRVVRGQRLRRNCISLLWVPMNVLFLDVDGVLNSDSWFSGPTNRDFPHGHLDPAAVARLASIVVHPSVHVVLSSTWRRVMPLFELEALLLTKVDAFPMRKFLGVTPRINGAPRGLEIQAWLDSWDMNPDGDDIDEIVILDDEPDMLHLVPRLVRTDSAVGLTDADVVKVKCLLRIV